MIKKIIFTILLLLYCLNVNAQYINKAFLKYNRSHAIDYARAFWSSINDTDGYDNYGQRFKDPSGNWWESCQTYGVHSSVSDCGGDCANFVCQCLFAGGISEYDLIQDVETAFLSFTQTHQTIANAEALGEQE